MEVHLKHETVHAAGKPTCAIWFPAIVSSLPLSGSTVDCASSAVFLQSPQLLTSCKPPPFRSTITSNTPILQTVFQQVRIQTRTFGIHRFIHRHSTHNLQKLWSEMSSVTQRRKSDFKNNKPNYHFSKILHHCYNFISSICFYNSQPILLA